MNVVIIIIIIITTVIIIVMIISILKSERLHLPHTHTKVRIFTFSITDRDMGEMFALEMLSNLKPNSGEISK